MSELGRRPEAEAGAEDQTEDRGRRPRSEVGYPRLDSSLTRLVFGTPRQIGRVTLGWLSGSATWQIQTVANHGYTRSTEYYI